MRLFGALCAAGLLMAIDSPAHAVMFAVDDLTDAVDAAPGDGECATARGTCTLRAAIQETNALAGADEIALAVGMHELSIPGADEDVAATGDLDVTDDLTIAGANAYLSVVDANGIDRVLHQRLPADVSADLQLRDLTLTGGDAEDEAGGGLLYDSQVDAERIIVRQNRAERGGGGLSANDLPFDDPALDLRLSIVSLNATTGGAGLGIGGGINAGYSDALRIERSIIIANTSDDSGAGVNIGGTYEGVATFDQVVVFGNNAIGSGLTNGGGINGSSLLIEQSWIGSNLVGEWGAAAPEPGGMGGGLFGGGEITNSTFSGNFADDGGAIGSNAPITLVHGTLARNAADGEGGALFLFGLTPTWLLQNTILAENSPQNCANNPPTSDGHNLADDDSCGLASAGDLESTDAQLGALGHYGGLPYTRSIPPLAGSPAIEGGTDAGIDVDQRGVARPQLAQFDIGAMELEDGRARQRYTGGFTSNPHPCDGDRNGRIDFADLDRLIANFPVAGGRFRGNATQRLRSCVAACTHAGCPPVALIPRPTGAPSRP